MTHHLGNGVGLWPHNTLYSCWYRVRLIDSDSFGEDGHQLIGASGGEGFAPVVGFGVVEFVEQGDGVADGGEAAE